MARNTVRGTPYRKLTSLSSEGIRPGTPKGADGQTTMKQYRGTGMDTKQSPRGTPYHSEAGNGSESKRTVSSDKYGKVIDDAAGNLADPAANGAGVVFDNIYSPAVDFRKPTDAMTMDSPVPEIAPRFDPTFIAKSDRAHLGSGNESAAESLVKGGGVMSRGLVGTSKKTDTSEEELTTDDTLPGTAPAGKAVRTDPSNFETISKYPKK